MKAMILAAGRGERLRPLTDKTPKPLLYLGERRLIEHHLLALAEAGFEDVVVNVAYKADMIVDALGDGGRYGLRIQYSHETPGALDTGGGIRQALPLLGETMPFAVVNADICTDYPYENLRAALDDSAETYLVLTDNPPHHPEGDFGLEQGHVTRTDPKLTFTGIGVYRPRLFTEQTQTRFGLASVLYQAIEANRALGEHYGGRWHDVGTPQAFERLGGYVESGHTDSDGERD